MNHVKLRKDHHLEKKLWVVAKESQTNLTSKNIQITRRYPTTVTTIMVCTCKQKSNQLYNKQVDFPH